MDNRDPWENHNSDLPDLELERLFKTFPSPILFISKEGKVLYANASSMPVLLHFGVEVGEVLSAKWWNSVLEEVVAPNLAKVLEIEEVGLVIELKITMFNEEKGVFCIIGRDVTTDRALEAEQLKSSRQEAITAMIVTYAHEVSNPLTIAVSTLSRPLDRLDENKLQKARVALNRIAEVIAKIRELENSDGSITKYNQDTAMFGLGLQKEKPKSGSKSDEEAG